MRARTMAVAVLVAMGLVGCAPFAPRTAMPAADLTQTDPAKRYPAADVESPLPHETRIDYIKQQMRAYISAWTAARYRIADTGFVFDEGVFYGSVTAAVGGIVSSPHTAIAGAAVAGGSSIISEHYGLKIQATNYLNGADTMQCLADRVGNIAQGVWDLYDDSGTLKVGRDYFANEKEAADGYDRLSDLIPTINDAMNKTVATLRKAQATVTFASPSVADITKAVSEGVQAKAASGGQSQALSSRLTTLAGSSSVNHFRSLSRANIAASDLQFSSAQAVAARAVVDPALTGALARALQLPADMNACLAAIGK